jgi:hypothetical protein
LIADSAVFKKLTIDFAKVFQGKYVRVRYKRRTKKINMIRASTIAIRHFLTSYARPGRNARPATTNRSGNGGKIWASERAGDARGHSYGRATKRPACGAARCRVGALKASPDQAPGAVSTE